MSARAKASAGTSRQQIDVCLDADIVQALCRVGTLFHTVGHGHSVYSFAYDSEWLRRPNTFEIDPDLQLHDAESYPSQTAGVFRIFTDSAPASRRFDRPTNGRRRCFVSAMTLLNRQDGENASYLELAGFISTRGSLTHKAADLHEMWARIVFNILVSNRDDHLRNHGFILAADGWRLAAAYDLNPNIERSHHQLAIDSNDPTPDVALALATAEYYGLTAAQAGKILQHLRDAVGQWRTVAATYRLPRAETELMAQAFL